jgi:hypothetical protein
VDVSGRRHEISELIAEGIRGKRRVGAGPKTRV